MRTILQQGCKRFFGVTYDDRGSLVADAQNPDAFVACQQKRTIVMLLHSDHATWALIFIITLTRAIRQQSAGVGTQDQARLFDRSSLLSIGLMSLP
jgi:hypothetical protein